jgi:HEAT repeat protein
MDKRRQLLIKALQDENENIRSNAAEALERLDTRARVDAISELIATGEKVEKLRAIYALSSLRGQAVVTLVSVALKDEVEDVRAAAYRVIGKIADLRALPILIEGLKDSSPIVERVVIDALGSFRDPQLLLPVMHMLKSKDPGVVERAIDIVGRSGDKRAEEAMLYFSVKGNLNMKYLAMKALGVMEES